ncbi:MAG: geranylgeranyl reductase family protein, partial [Candidatus Aenigmarchaeota archaeon]|nr:geranylgeranyl reductase family protein [Candidatus Aenigmarchaeota archaeon]
AGSVAAMFLAKAGKNVLLVDKARFPRDKTCGDAQGRKAAAIMTELGIYEGYTKLPGQKIYGITLSSPNGTVVDVDVEQRGKPAPGYVHKRMDFDNYLFQHAKNGAAFRIFTITDVIVESGCAAGVRGTNESGKEEEIRAKIILAADGAHSIVARKFGVGTNPAEHLIAATRAYYKNVQGLSDRIEIHLVRELIPGYFWIFPLGNNECNVGLGMIIKDMNKKRINLVEAQKRTIAENPLFKERFKNAELQGDIRGWNLPIASYHRKCYGPGFLLLGDAAALIDPLSGEGIGNAMISGKIAAKVAIEALEKGDFSEKFLRKYDKELWSVIGDEIKANYRLQKLGKMFPYLIDRLIVKASKDENFRKKLEAKLPYTGGRKDMGTVDFLKEIGHEGMDELALEVEEQK